MCENRNSVLISAVLNDPINGHDSGSLKIVKTDGGVVLVGG